MGQGVKVAPDVGVTVGVFCGVLVALAVGTGVEVGSGVGEGGRDVTVADAVGTDVAGRDVAGGRDVACNVSTVAAGGAVHPPKIDAASGGCPLRTGQ